MCEGHAHKGGISLRFRSDPCKGLPTTKTRIWVCLSKLGDLQKEKKVRVSFWLPFKTNQKGAPKKTTHPSKPDMNGNREPFSLGARKPNSGSEPTFGGPKNDTASLHQREPAITSTLWPRAQIAVTWRVRCGWLQLTPHAYGLRCFLPQLKIQWGAQTSLPLHDF